MGSDQAVLRKMRIGQLHGGLFPTGSITRYNPDVGVYNLPFQFRNFDEADYVRKQMDEGISKGLEKGGLINFGFMEGGFAYLLSQEPVTNIAELRQQKVWIPEGDNASLQVLKAIGVSPIPLGISDVLASLQTGLVNTVATSPIAAIALQWHTQVKYMMDLPLLYIYATLVMDGKAFQTISPEDQKIVREVMKETMSRIDRQNRKDNEQAYLALGKQGIELVKPTGSSLEEWRKISSTAVDVLLADKTLEENIVSTMLNHLKTYRARDTVAGPDSTSE